MKKQKTTKRALLLSALSLVLCVSMLVGSTYAWFTDSVTSGSNVITSGNLDLEVQYTLDGENWADLSGATDLFSKGLWEPGHTEVVALKVSNVGSLALQYVANMNIFTETLGKSVLGNVIVLSEILQVSSMNMDGGPIGDALAGYFFTGEDAMAGSTDMVHSIFKEANILGEHQLLLPGESKYVLIRVDMPETVGNEANHDGVHVPSIEFGLNFLATQFTYENDSFGNQYDRMATVDTVEELKEALAADYDCIMLGNSMVLNESIVIPADKTVTIDLAGHVMRQTKGDIAAAYAMIDNKGNLTIKDSVGAGKISFADTTPYTGNIGWASNTIRNTGVLTVVSGTIENVTAAEVMNFSYPHAIDCYQGSVTNITGGTVKSANYDSIRMFCNSTTEPTTVNISGGTIINRVSFQAPTSNKADNGVLNITGGNFITTDGVSANVRLLAFSTDLSAMKANISGGTFDKGVGVSNYSGAAVTWKPVTGGTFGANPANFVADGYAASAKHAAGISTYTVAEDATVKKGVGVEVGAGEDVVIKDEEVMGRLEIMDGNASVTDTTVEATGDKLYGGTTRGEDGYTVYENVDIYSMGGGISALNGGDVLFKSGVVDIQNVKSRHLFYAGSSGDTSEITIEGGTFNLKNKKVTSSYLVAEGNAVIYVKGGDFAAKATKDPVQEVNGGKVIITGGTFAWDPTAWVAEGYEAVLNGTTWTVQAK